MNKWVYILRMYDDSSSNIIAAYNDKEKAVKQGQLHPDKRECGIEVR